MELGIRGRRAVITGASGGIGRAIAGALAAEGVDVALIARSSDLLAQAAMKITDETGVRAIAIPADLRDIEAIQSAAKTAQEQLGQIDILVNSAGAIPASSLESLSDEALHSAWSLKLSGYVRMSRALLPEMRTRGWGRIVNIIGLGGKNPSAGHMYGSAANAALMNFTGALALEVATEGVLVNAINPGMIKSERILEMAQKWADDAGMPLEELMDKQTAALPMHRMGTLEEVADVATFLCSERCTYVHGAIIPVAGAMGVTL